MNSVFKYRTCTSEFHFNCLSKREIYFSSFEKNRSDDPEEGKFLVDFADINVDLLVSRIRAHQPNVTLDFLNERIEYFLNPSNRAEILADFQMSHEDVLDRSGIFCVSRSNSNTNNWRKFGNNENGFVVEYDLDYFKNYHVQDVRYTDERPSINFNDLMRISENPSFFNQDGNKYLELKYLYKPLKYKREDEIRIITVSENPLNRAVYVDRNSILSVTIGRNVNEDLKRKIFMHCEQGEISLKKISVL